MQENIICGFHAVLSVLNANPQTIGVIWLDRQRADKRQQELIEAAQQARIKLQRVPKAKLDTLVEQGMRHQGVVAQLQGRRRRSESELPDLLDSIDTDPLLLILDSIQDPHNLGACLRSAEAAGVHAVILPKDKSAPLSATVHKAASGAADIVPIFTVTNLVRTMEQLKARNIWFVGAAGEADTSLYDAELSGPLCIVMGSEGKGLRRLTREHCDRLLHIPMRGSIESLNVSVATGIILFEAVRQRLG